MFIYFLVISTSVHYQIFFRHPVLYTVAMDCTFRYLRYSNLKIFPWNKTTKNPRAAHLIMFVFNFFQNTLYVYSMHVRLFQIPSTKIKCGRGCLAMQIT